MHAHCNCAVTLSLALSGVEGRTTQSASRREEDVFGEVSPILENVLMNCVEHLAKHTSFTVTLQAKQTLPDQH